MEEEDTRYGWKTFFAKDLGPTLLWFVLLAALGLTIGYIGAKDLALKVLGQEAQALVVSHDVTGMSHSSDRSYIIDYTFVVNDETQFGTVSSRSSRLQSKYDEGETMPIYYLEKYPIINGVPDRPSVLTILIWVFALIPLIGALFALKYLFKCFLRALMGK